MKAAESSTPLESNEPLISELSYMIVCLHRDMYTIGSKEALLIHEVVVKPGETEEVALVLLLNLLNIYFFNQIFPLSDCVNISLANASRKISAEVPELSGISQIEDRFLKVEEVLSDVCNFPICILKLNYYYREDLGKCWKGHCKIQDLKL